MKILIDPGHGKKENKGVYTEYREGTQMWNLAQKIIARLGEYDCEVSCTRPSINDNPLPEDRGKMAEGYDIFLSLHSNTPGSEDKGKPSYEKTTGTIAFYSVVRPKDKEFATKLAKLVADIMGTYSRGADDKAKKNGEDWYAVIRNAIAVGCDHPFIIEHGFHTNKHDCSFLLDDKGLEKLAEGEVQLITSYYHIGKKILPPKDEIQAGDIVTISDGAVYSNGVKVPSSVKKREWVVDRVKENFSDTLALLGKTPDGKHTCNSYVAVKYLAKVGTTNEGEENNPSAATFPKPIGYNGSSIVTALNRIGAQSSFSYRRKIAKANGISAYLGTAKQNAKLLDLLKKGELLKP